MAMAAEPLGVIEFYSGLGGWHYALRETGLHLKVLAAVEINTTANEVYRHNFPTTKILQRNILGLTAGDLDSFSADLFTLSPPCQPFTRQGKKEDNRDHRTDSFFHLMDNILGTMRNPPKYIMMENVKGFESSRTREHFVLVLTKRGYTIQEFLLSPKQFGIPNSRLRYYLVARLQPLSFSPSPLQESVENLKQYFPTNLSDIQCHISGYLDNLSDTDIHPFLVPEKVLDKYAMGLDIVSAESLSSCCFTRGYYHYAVGTGSVLQHDCSVDLDLAFQSYIQKKADDDSESLKSLKELKLRYFTPREVANLMCFPPSHSYPTSISLRQCYQLLGNSVNVLVIGIILRYLLIQNN